MSNILESLNRGLETKYFSDMLDEAVYGGSKWSNLSDEERQGCLNADPTYNGKEDSAGKYSEWILKIYSAFKKDHPNERFRFEHCKDTLTQFMRSKENLRDTSKKDIFQFNSLDELDTFLNDSQSFKDTFVEAPADENSIKDAKKIFENGRCEIWVPLTHAASVALAGEPKTKWCTAFPNPYNYNEYTEEGPLFILIMKDNSGDMYQFHFESKSAMDKYDDEVEWEDFPEMRSQEVKNFRKEYFRKEDEAACKQLDSLLNGRTPISELGGDWDRVSGLIKSIHDEDTALNYSGPLDKECLEQFYANLTPVLDQNSPSIQWLERCIGKVDIVLPSSVRELKSGCFEWCESIRSIVVPDNITSIGEYAFADCRSLESIVIPDSVTSIGCEAFSSCSSLESVTIPDGVTSIEKDTFQDCSSLKSIVIPDGVTSIGRYAFYSCSSLGSVVIPDSVTSIGYDAFMNCSSLKSIVIPNRVTSVEKGTVDNCHSLKSVVIGDSVTSIGRHSFSSDFSLESVVIPKSVTSIEGDAFHRCASLKDIYYGGSQEDRKMMQIDINNDDLLNATWHYNYKGNFLE